MNIRLFDLQNGVIVPTVHCHTLKFLKDVMDLFPEDYLKIYQYYYYMCCPDQLENPFFNFPESTKEETILREIDAEFSPEDDVIRHGLGMCMELYTTPTRNAFLGIKVMLENLSTYMRTATITSGRDGNITALVNTAAKFDQIRESYKGAFKDLQDEQKSTVRGGQTMAYDQM
jgi:hypothetical protein